MRLLLGCNLNKEDVQRCSLRFRQHAVFRYIVANDFVLQNEQ